MDTTAERGTSSVSYIPAENVDAIIIEKLKKATRHTEEDWSDYASESYLIRKLTEKSTSLFMHDAGCFIAFEVLRSSSNKTFLNVIWSGGEGIELALEEFNRIADHLAESFECEWIEMTGRVGWKRMLKPFGFTEASVTLKREPQHVLRRRQSEGNADN